MSKTPLVMIALTWLSAFACRSSMGTRKDASPSPEVGLSEVAADSLTVSDLTQSDLPAADAITSQGVPKAFRIENHTDRTIYVSTDEGLGCKVGGTTGWQTCAYFHACSVLCPNVQDPQACCVECEQSLELYAIAAGQSRSLPWDGNIFMRQTGRCSQCQCEQPIAVTGGDFEVSARAYTDYRCTPSGCQAMPDGTIRMASPLGPFTTSAKMFGIPFAGEEVVIAFSPPDQDAGTRDTPVSLDGQPALDGPADLPLTDSGRDSVSEPMPAILSDVAGHQFTMAADEALPDASLYGRSCGTSRAGAHYRLTFSDDGRKVTIVRTDPVQEVVLEGTLTTSSSATLNYELTPAFAGASLDIRREGESLIGVLAMHGSGVPVIWCIESPMRRV